MPLDFELGKLVRLKKKHPCGSYEWEVVRLGADIGIQCVKCQHRILVARATLERRSKDFTKGGGDDAADNAHRP